MCNRYQAFRFEITICSTVKLHEWLVFFSWPFETIFYNRRAIIYTFFPTNQSTSSWLTFDKNISRCFRYTGTRNNIKIFWPWTSLKGRLHSSYYWKANILLLDWMLELEIDMVDRVINQQQYNQDHVHDRQYEKNYQNSLLELRNQWPVNRHHNQDRLELKNNNENWKDQTSIESTPTKM